MSSGKDFRTTSRNIKTPSKLINFKNSKANSSKSKKFAIKI